MLKQQQEQLDKISNERASPRQEQADPPLDIRRSSVGSTGVPADDALLARYPVDDIKEKTNCELHQKMKNISMKVAVDFALSNEPEGTIHGNPIPGGYARVGVDEVLAGYDSLELDIPGGEGEQTLGEARRWGVILW